MTQTTINSITTKLDKLNITPMKKKTTLCSHNLQKQYCKKCKGGMICSHNLQRRQCKKCKGSVLCPCGRNKYLCSKHGGSNLCNSCKMSQKSRKYSNKYCLDCYRALNPELVKNIKKLVRKQDILDRVYQQLYPKFKWDLKDKIINDSCNKRRPDYFIDCKTHCIILEVDENQHKHYDKQCEVSRVNELFTGLGDRKLIFVRLNVDSYRYQGIKKRSCFYFDKKLKFYEDLLKVRIHKTHKLIKMFLDYEYVEGLMKDDLVYQHYLYYDS